MIGDSKDVRNHFSAGLAPSSRISPSHNDGPDRIKEVKWLLTSSGTAQTAAMLSNLSVYLAIAESAFAEAQRLEALGRRPKPNGEPGFIITFDPDQKSFKQSLIAIVFAGVYLDALLYFVGTQRLGKSEYLKIDRRKTYEEKLAALDISDPKLLEACKRFRKARNELVHEKAIDMEEITVVEFQRAQEEAALGISFVRSAAIALQERL